MVMQVSHLFRHDNENKRDYPFAANGTIFKALRKGTCFGIYTKFNQGENEFPPASSSSWDISNALFQVPKPKTREMAFSLWQ